jgi:hypothetical protein
MLKHLQSIVNPELKRLEEVERDGIYMALDTS